MDRAPPAEVAQEPLVEALHGVLAARGVCTLTASDGISERVVYFAEGGIRMFSAGPRETAGLCDVLVSLGVLAADGVGSLRSAARDAGKPVAETAVACGMARLRDIAAGLRELLVEELIAMLVWPGAQISCSAGAPPERVHADQFESVSVTCEPGELVEAALRRIDACRPSAGRLPAPGDYLKNVADGSPHTSPEVWRFLTSLDGERRLDAAIAASSLRPAPAFELVCRAIANGTVQRTAGAAGKHEARDDVVREIAALERALATAAAPEIVRRRLADAYQRAGEKSRAAGQWRWLGDQHRARREFDAALTCYRAAVRQMPADFQTRELILEIHRHRRDHKQLVSDGRPLADLLLRHNLADRARKLLQQLVQLLPDDAALRREYALVLTALGHSGAAIEQLHALARILEQRRAPDHELRDVHLRVLALDSSDQTSGLAYAKLTGTRGFRRLLMAASGVVVVAAIGTGLFVLREFQNREELAVALAQVDELVQDGRFDDAATELARLEAEHRFSRSAETIRGYRASVDAARRARVPVLPTMPDTTTSPAADRMAIAAFDAADDGDVEGAHAILARLIATHPHSQAARTAALPLRVRPVPRDATVYLDGVELGQGAVELRYTPSEAAVLRVERSGFEPVERVLTEVVDLDLTVALSKPVLWRNTYGAEIVSQPLVLAKRVIVALSDRSVAALHPDEGDVLWRTSLGMYDDVTAGPYRGADGVYVGTSAGNVLCLDITTGEPVWSKAYEQAVVGPFVPSGLDFPVVTLASGEIVGPGPSGPGGPGGVAVAATTGAVTPGSLVSHEYGIALADGNGRLRVGPALDPQRWSEAGNAALVAPPGSAVDGGRVWGLCDDGQLRLYTGTTRMLRALAAPSVLRRAPCAFGETAVIACEGGRLLAYRTDGAVAFDVTLPEEIAASPVFSAGRLLVSGTDGTLFVLDDETGAEEWRLSAGAPVTQPAAATSARIYVAAGSTVIAVER